MAKCEISRLGPVDKLTQLSSTEFELLSQHMGAFRADSPEITKLLKEELNKTMAKLVAARPM